MTAEDGIGTEQKTKGEQLLEFFEEKMENRPPHQYGWCEECESEVWVDVELAWGAATNCNQHLPLCRYQDGGCDA